MKTNVWKWRASVACGSILALAACSGGGGGGAGPDAGVDPNGSECSAPFSYDLPFDYVIENDDLFINTPGGRVRAAIGPWGAHASPHTGHFEGNAKSDWAAMFADSWQASEMVRLDGEGPCAKGDLCGVHLDDVTERLPAYIAPVDGFEVVEVILEEITDSHEHDRYKWEIVGTACPYRYGMGHVGAIADDLRQALLDRGLADPNTYDTPGELFRDYDNPIVLDAGASLGIPQIRYEEIEGHPGYVKGWGGVGATPWAQIEFSAFDVVNPEHENQWGAEWRFLSAAKREQLEAVLVKEGNRPESFKYDQPWVQDWLWRSEMVLEATEPFYLDEQGSLFSRLGGWFERFTAPCEPHVDAECDEILSIFPIHKNSEFYDAGLYHSADVAYLVIHRDGDTINEGEVLTADVDEVSGTLVFRWRPTEGKERFEVVSYRVMSEPSRLVLVHGGEAATVEALPAAPAVPVDDSGCGDINTTCFTQLGFGEQQQLL